MHLMMHFGTTINASEDKTQVYVRNGFYFNFTNFIYTTFRNDFSKNATENSPDTLTSSLYTYSILRFRQFLRG